MITHGINLAAHVGNKHVDVIYLKIAHRPRWNVCEPGNFFEDRPPQCGRVELRERDEACGRNGDGRLRFMGDKAAKAGQAIAQGGLDSAPEGDRRTGAPITRARQAHVHGAVCHVQHFHLAAVRVNVGPNTVQRRLGLSQLITGQQVVQQKQ